MAISSTSSDKEKQIEARWPSVLATLATGGLYLALPDRLTLGPNWTLLLVICLLLIPIFVTHRQNQTGLNHRLGLVLSGITTLTLLWSLAALVGDLPQEREQPAALLRAAMALWVSNILVFAGWYWRLDAGGPHARDLRDDHQEGAFLFPQMTIEANRRRYSWKPGFVDYLFLAFNTSTAFSPTDVPVLSRWAKLLMMIQSTISLATVVVLAARAVNIL